MIKTLIMEDETKRPLIVLMHGDRGFDQESGAADRRQTISPCTPEMASKHPATGRWHVAIRHRESHAGIPAGQHSRPAENLHQRRETGLSGRAGSLVLQTIPAATPADFCA